MLTSKVHTIIRILSLSGLLALFGCAREAATPARIPQASDSLYTAKAAMRIYGTQPERALTIIDSAVIVGNLNPFRADFFRAVVYANSLEDPQVDKAIALCTDLLQHDSTQVVSKSTANNRADVLGVMMDASRKRHDDEQWLRCAIELAQLSRDRGMETEALRMEAEIGSVLTRLGRWEEGMVKLDQTIHTLEQSAPSIDHMDALIIARKRKMSVLSEAGRFREIIPEAEAILHVLEDYQSRPDSYAEDSFRLPSTQNRAPYCRFYQAQAWAYLASAYALMPHPDPAEARKYIRLFEESDYGHTFGGRVMIAPVWKALGQWDKLLAVDDEVERRMGTDTLNDAYAKVLKDRADAARARKQFPLALSYMDRYSALKEQLNGKNMETQVQEYAARYHAMEQDQKIREAETASARKDTVIVIVLVIALLIAIFAILAVRQRRSIVAKNRALVRMINELNDTRVAIDTDTSVPDQKLFDLIDGIIRKEKLYTNVYLQRQDIVDRFDISRRSLNGLLSAYANGQSFTAYVNNLRLEDAVHQLQDRPDRSISEIAESVGFTPANFREQFKRQYGMTPTEYKNNL